jgi:hypothetical protein
MVAKERVTDIHVKCSQQKVLGSRLKPFVDKKAFGGDAQSMNKCYRGKQRKDA